MNLWDSCEPQCKSARGEKLCLHCCKGWGFPAHRSAILPWTAAIPWVSFMADLTQTNTCKLSFILPLLLEHIKHWEFMHSVQNVTAFAYSKPKVKQKCLKYLETKITFSSFMCIFVLGMFRWQQEKQNYEEKIFLSKYQWKLGRKLEKPETNLLLRKF